MRTQQKKITLCCLSPHLGGEKKVGGVLDDCQWYTRLYCCSTDIKVWDIIAELVHICTCPSPPNPFAVDLDYFEALPVRERLLATAAMISLLRLILDSGIHRYDRRGAVLVC